MAITARFRHSLTLRQVVPAGATDGRGQRATTITEATVAGLIQEREARDIPTGELAGLRISDAIAFLPVSLPFVPDELVLDGVTYEALGVPRDAGARGRHRELDLRRVAP